MSPLRMLRKLNLQCLGSLLVIAVLLESASAQNDCDRKSSVLNGSVPIEDALRGTVVRVTYINYLDGLSSWDTATGKWSGFLPDLMMQASIKAGFTVNATNSEGPKLGQTFTQWVLNELDSGQHVVGDWITNTAERISLGVNVDFGFLDVSLVSVRKKTISEEPSMMESMTVLIHPFSGKVWLLMFTTVSVTACAMWALERQYW